MKTKLLNCLFWACVLAMPMFTACEDDNDETTTTYYTISIVDFFNPDNNYITNEMKDALSSVGELIGSVYKVTGSSAEANKAKVLAATDKKAIEINENHYFKNSVSILIQESIPSSTSGTQPVTIKTYTFPF